MTKSLRHQPVNSWIYEFNDATVRQELDDYGNHRIVVKLNGKMETPSGWRNYKGIAKLTVNGTTFCGVSDYWSSVFPSVFKLIEPS
jgi:hypothetical protein